MPAKIITIMNQKGGSGKTTIAMMLAAAIARRKRHFDSNNKVLVADCDPQYTAVRWAASAQEGNLFPATVVDLSSVGYTVHRELQHFCNDYDHIIVDCPPTLETLIPVSALQVSDLVIIPITPSPLDLWSSVRTKKVIQTVQESKNNLKARLLVNQASKTTFFTREIGHILSSFDIPMFDTFIYHRESFRHAASHGCSVHDLGAKHWQAAADIESFTDEVFATLDHET